MAARDRIFFSAIARRTVALAMATLASRAVLRHCGQDGVRSGGCRRMPPTASANLKELRAVDTEEIAQLKVGVQALTGAQHQAMVENQLLRQQPTECTAVLCPLPNSIGRDHRWHPTVRSSRVVTGRARRDQRLCRPGP